MGTVRVAASKWSRISKAGSWPRLRSAPNWPPSAAEARPVDIATPGKTATPGEPSLCEQVLSTELRMTRCVLAEETPAGTHDALVAFDSAGAQRGSSAGMTSEWTGEAWDCFLVKTHVERRSPMPDVYETDTTRTQGGRDTPHISDAPTISPAMPAEDTRTTWRSRLSWGAILAGVVIALITQIVLNLIGIAVGAALLAPLSGGSPLAASFSTGAGIWFALSTILAALAGGYTAGKFSGMQNESTAGWHGLTTWALTTLLLSYLLSSALGGLGGDAKSSAQTAVQAAAPILVQIADPFSSIELQLRSVTSGNDPAALRDVAIAAVRAAVTGDQLQAAEARERATQAIARAENISVADARTQVQHYEQEYRQAVDQARQQAAKAADDAAKAVSRAALLGAISLLLGGLAGWLGGRMAAGEQSLGARLATAFGRARR
jgi:hypothetical protein